MHPLIPYLLGQPHPQGKRLVNVQRCLRTQDIDEVGDQTHLTLFEMLGNWSLGDYSNHQSLPWSLEFLVEVIGLDKRRIGTTIFSGNDVLPKDYSSRQIWQELGIEWIGETQKDNWWGPPSNEGPCGPDSEIFYWTLSDEPTLSPGQDDQGWVEIWNNVMIRYNKTSSGYRPLDQQNIDTGIGLERLLILHEGVDSVYQTELFRPLIDFLGGENRSSRIISDHVRSVCFLGMDQVMPSNQGRGYVLRRLLRSSIRHGRLLELREGWLEELVDLTIETYQQRYPKMRERETEIKEMISSEEKRFSKSLTRGTKQISKLLTNKSWLSGEDIHHLFETHGFPPEISIEEILSQGGQVNKNWQDEFNICRKEHRRRSQ
jgi:alanyl-tRNA synthetase